MVTRCREGRIILYLLLAQLSGCVEQDAPENIARGSTIAKISMVCRSLIMSYVDRGRFPENENEFANVLTTGDAYIRSGALIDGWKQPLHYERKSESDAAIWSSGGDDKQDKQAIRCSVSVDPGQAMVTVKEVNTFLRSETKEQHSLSDYARK